MARAATTTDVFNAVAELRRRQILDLLAGGESSVGDLVERVGLTQPQVSKHLKVLSDVGLVQARPDGRQRIYRLDVTALVPLQGWLSRLEQIINARYDRLDSYLAELQTSPKTTSPKGDQP